MRGATRVATSAAIAVLLGFSAVYAYVAIVNKNDHQEIHIVPAPGKVEVDGDLKDWDLSGAILMFLDESSKAAYSVRGAMMYDKDFLYVGGTVKDPTPMVNNHAFGGDVDMAWNADAIQIRFVSNPAIKSNASIQTGGRMSPEDQKYVNHITLWYSTIDGKAGFQVCYTLGFTDGALNPPGVEGAYKKNADSKGYTFEYRIPWAVLRAPRPLVGGDTVQTSWQLHWGNDLGKEVRCGMTDVRNPASGDLGYMGPGAWGKGIFEKSGNLRLAEEERSAGRAEGHIPIRFTLEKDGKVSLAICDGKGKLVRTCLGAEPYKTGENTYLWDGLDDFDKPVPPGTYTAKILTHAGIKQKLVCDVGVSGTPPYQTEDGKGGWAGDYNTPQCVAVEGERVVLGTANAEAAPHSIGTDLEGRKQFGTAAHGLALALHKGYGYFVTRGGGKLLKFDLDKGLLAPFPSGRPEAEIVTRGAKEDDKSWGSRTWQLFAVTAAGDTLVVSSLGDNKLVLMDPVSGAIKGEAPLDKPRGLAGDSSGTLYAVSGNAVGRYDLQARQFTPLAKDLEEPRHLACDKDGNVYVSLQGKTMQVWKLGKDGKVIQRYGKEGGRPEVGKFDPSGMLNPFAIAVDKNGRLWVVEADHQPKRYSVWNPDGTLWKEFFGSLDYATTGYVDLENPEYIYAQCVRYKVDYEKGTWYPDATVIGRGYVGTHGGAVLVNQKGRKFLCASAEGKGLMLHEVVGDRVAPIRTNGALPSYYWTPVVDQNLGFYYWQGETWHAQGGAKTTKPYSIACWDFKGFSAQAGVNCADFAAPRVVASDPDGGAVASVAVDEEANVYALVSGGSLERGVRPQGTGHRVVKFSPKGEKLWEYQNVHCAFAWTSDAYTPGYVVGAMVFSRGSTKDLVAVTGYYGQYFLLDKQEGLFVDALGEDQRSPYTLDQHMVLTENFNGTLFQNAKNGKTYFLGGDADLRLWELTGLETLKRQSMPVTVTAEQVARAQKNAAQNAAAQRGALVQKTVKVPRLKNAAADGKCEEWNAVPVQTICMEGGRTAQGQVGYDDTCLYARFQVADDSPLINTPTDYKLLFKSGDAVEVYVGAELKKRAVRGQNQQEMAAGDTRIIIARTPEGKMIATRYRPVTAEKDKPNKASFTTQSSGTDTFDEIVAWNDLPMHCKAEKDSYVVEVAIPWATLGIAPKSGLALVGDLGVIYGNQGGTKNAIRYMGSDKSPEVSINNDIPSESRLHPNQWAKLVLE